MMIRTHAFQRVLDQFEAHPACAILGPRQCGKTTLAEQVGSNWLAEGLAVHRFDLENPEDYSALQSPLRALEDLSGLVILDEIQRLPELFPILRILCDRQKAQYLILGSASRDLMRQSAESLAGRVGYIELTPFQLHETKNASPLLLRGGFPRAFLAKNDRASVIWREAFIQTFLEQDIPNLGFDIPAMMLRRFWMMLTHYHGQLINLSQLGTALGLSAHTVRRYLDILMGTFMVRVMPPWFENIGKRQVKTPKLYFRDSGLLLTLMGIKDEMALLHHPARGAIWEGFALEQLLGALDIPQEEAFFWRTQHGAELDLLVMKNGERWGFEFKFSDAPTTSRSMHQALADLKLKHLYVIYPGQRKIGLHEKITAISLEEAVFSEDLCRG